MTRHALIKDYMTSQPHSVRPGETLDHAHQMMKKHNIRHLPVLEKGRVVGILSERDFSLLQLYPDMDLKTSKVEDLMIQGVDSYRPDASLSEIVSTMAERKVGSVVVTDDSDNLLGIFTSIDALRLLGKIYDPS